MSIARELFAKAATLPPNEREELALRLLKSLPDCDDPDVPFVLTDEDEQELNRRSERHRNDPQAAHTAGEAIAELQSLVDGNCADDRAD